MMKHLDNLNHEISVGDRVFYLTGSDARTIKTVCKLGKRKREPFDDIGTVTLDSKITLSASNLID